jgi:hypothetical protein
MEEDYTVSRAVSHLAVGNGHGDRVNFGRSLITLALALVTIAAWTRVTSPGSTLGFRLLVGAALLSGYLGVVRSLRRKLNWLELIPRSTAVSKTEIEGFVSLSVLLSTGAGLTLLANLPAPVAPLISCNIVCGLMIVDFSRRLRRREVSVSGTTYNLVNPGVYGVLRGLLGLQLRFLLMSVAFTMLLKL